MHLDGRVYGKPADRADAARDAARALGAHPHASSPASACSRGGCEVVEHDATRRHLPRARRRATSTRYLASGEWERRAGAYAIQGLGGRLVERIEGDYLNVVGLPGAALIELLERHAPELLQIRS